MTKFAVLVFTALAASSTVALAHSIVARETEQNRWIEDGRRSGSITWREGIKLRREQRAIARVETDMKADGHLSRGERGTLNRLQDRAEADIAYKRNNGWRRWRWLPRVGR